MLTILLGTDWVKNRDTVLDMVANDVSSGKGGRVLLVPELISHDVERRLCAAAGDASTLYAEVVSFTRMVRAVSDCAGKGMEPCLDNGGRLVAMAATTRQLHSVLKAYASVETKPEFLTDLVATVDEFKQCCITSADLNKAASMTTGSLAQKLEELALILDTYDGICRHGKRDPADQMNWLLEEMEGCSYAQDRVFYVDGFPDFTAQHMKILEHIILNSPSVTITLNCDQPDSGKLSFEKVGDTASQIIRFAKSNGITFEIRYVEEEQIPTSEIRSRLYQGETNHKSEYDSCLSVYHCGSVYQECAAAAQQIRALVNDNNRYRDISVVCGNMSNYQNTLMTVFRRFGIPIYISGTENILIKPVISALLTAINAALGGFETKDVLSYLKSSICPLDTDAADELENYAYSWNIQGTLWTKEWKMHPLGLSKEWKTRDYDKIARINASREVAVAPLDKLHNAFINAKNLSQQVRAIYGFMEEIRLAETFENLADIAKKTGDRRGAQVFNQLWEILMSALEQLHDVLGTTIWDKDTFARLLRLLLSQYDIGTIPPVLDTVAVGPAKAMRCQQTKHLIVLGANEGNFPTYSSAAGVLSQQERVALQGALSNLNGGAENTLRGEFYDIYGTFCGARESIYVSAGPGEPSFAFRRLSQLAGGERSVPDEPTLYVGDRVDAGAFLARINDEKAAEDLSLNDVYGRMTKGQSYGLGSVSEEQIEAIYGDTIHLSPTSISAQAKCRLNYFLCYGLRIRELEQYSINAAAFGTYVHYVLEQTCKAVIRRGGFASVTLDETVDIAKAFSEQYILDNFSEVESARDNYLLHRNLGELLGIVEELWEEMSQSQFSPTHFELEFGKESPYPAVPIENTKIPADLDGKIDRIDTWSDKNNQYYRVVDYKTGYDNKLDYSFIQIGLGLQMLLYMFALQDIAVDVFGKKAEPAGVLYFPAAMRALPMKGHPDDAAMDKERSKAWIRSSLLLNDETVLKAMCTDLAKIGIKIDKENKVTGDLLTGNEFETLKKYVKKTLSDLVNDITSGCVDPNPYIRAKADDSGGFSDSVLSREETDSSCKFCPYKIICHPVENAEFKALASTSLKKFWEKL